MCSAGESLSCPVVSRGLVTKAWSARAGWHFRRTNHGSTGSSVERHFDAVVSSVRKGRPQRVETPSAEVRGYPIEFDADDLGGPLNSIGKGSHEPQPG